MELTTCKCNLKLSTANCRNIGKYTGIYTIATMDEECENCSWKTTDKVVLIELHLHEKVSH